MKNKNKAKQASSGVAPLCDNTAEVNLVLYPLSQKLQLFSVRPVQNHPLVALPVPVHTVCVLMTAGVRAGHGGWHVIRDQGGH